jgi:2-hydroxy-3-oxopropionate reductase
MEIGWIGTGIMGAPMARNLMRAGHRLRLHNRSAKRAVALAAESADFTVAADPTAAAGGAELVFIMAPDTPDVENVVARIEPALHKGQTVIDMSTVAPAAERVVAERLAKAGVDYLDAPVSGGES